MITETWTVTGMHCPKCVARVEKALGKIEGIESSKADFEADTCVVTYDGTAETKAAAVAAITDLDFVVE